MIGTAGSNPATFPFQPNSHDFETKITGVDSGLAVQEEHSTSFVMLSAITPVPDFQRPSKSETRLPANVLLACTTRTKTDPVY